MVWRRKRGKPVYIIGDIHGHFEKLVHLLRGEGLINANHSWSGGESRLWFLGDFFDRGPDGVSSIDLIMRLQREAGDAGAEIHALLGNHEVLFLGAYIFGRTPFGSVFALGWTRNGGVKEDMRRVKDAHLEWLKNLPAMALVENRLLLHADATLYTHYGDSIEAVNHYFRTLLHSNNPQGWDQLLDAFSERMMFFHPANGISRARDFLRIFGGRQIIHGHTPIHYMDSNIKLEDIREPLVYASGLCMNVDAGMYLGGPGLVYRLPL